MEKSGRQKKPEPDRSQERRQSRDTTKAGNTADNQEENFTGKKEDFRRWTRLTIMNGMPYRITSRP